MANNRTKRFATSNIIMIKLTLILITLTAFARMSYAFFPVLVSHQTEVVDTFISANGSESFSYTVLGFFIGFF